MNTFVWEQSQAGVCRSWDKGPPPQLVMCKRMDSSRQSMSPLQFVIGVYACSTSRESYSHRRNGLSGLPGSPPPVFLWYGWGWMGHVGCAAW